MRKLLRFILVIGIFVLLGFLVWKPELLFTYFVDPIARILWLFYRTLRSVDQITYWILLVLTALPVIIRMLPVGKGFSDNPAYKNLIQIHDRVLYWETLIIAAEKDKYARLELQRSLQTLSQSIENLSFGNDQEDILLPPNKKGFQEWVQKARILLPLSQYIQWKKVHSVSELEKCIDQILESMELQMESTHD